MLIEHQQRESRVRFQHPIRVVTLEGQPRVIRTLTSNVSRDGLFLRMPEPLPPGMKVALSLEAGGRALALAQAEVVWTGIDERELTERFPGCGVRFTEFMHPRAEELVRYLVHNLDKGKPLMLAPPERRWMRWAPFAAGGALLVCAALAMVVLWGSSSVDLDDESAPSLTMVAEPPTVRAVESQPATPPREAQVLAKPDVVVAPPTVTDPSPPAPAVNPTLLTDSKGSAPDAPPLKADEAKPDSLLAPTPPIDPKSKVAPTRIIVAATQLTTSPAEKKSVEKNVDRDTLSPPEARVVPAPRVVKQSVEPKPLTGTRSPPAAKVAKPEKNVQRGTLKLPSGAASGLSWSVIGTELRLAPELGAGAQVTHAFVLTNPARAVFDLSGGVPTLSHVVPAAPPYATSVRLGKQGTGTRIVIDLDSAPKRTAQDGAALVLSF